MSEDSMLVNRIIDCGMINEELKEEAIIIADRMEDKDDKLKYKVWGCYAEDLMRYFKNDAKIHIDKDIKAVIKHEITEQLIQKYK